VSRDGPVWPTALMPEIFQKLQPSDVETLLISGSVDFATPAEYAPDELLPLQSNGRQVILSEMGHVNDVVSLQPKAYEYLITTFYRTGEVDDRQFDYAPMEFEVKWGFPILAKEAFGGIAGFLLAIIVGIWFVIQRYRRNNPPDNPSGL